MYIEIAIYFGVFLTTLIGVNAFRHWSIERQLLDIPNGRSSHSFPTPRGGGVVICLLSLVTFCIYLIYTGKDIKWSFFAGALIVAIISLIDDLKTISPLFRIIFHGLAAGLVVFELGSFEKIFIPFYGNIEIGLAGYVFGFLWIVWLINAYNFMDGIDGIAATQAVTAGVGWCFIGYLFGADDISFFGGVLAASSLGFLVLNWQPAKIFMGDVGSAFLGYSFAVLPILCLKRVNNIENASLLPLIGILLVWFFLFDSVQTFLKRLFRGEKVWQAHREHIYQRLLIAGSTHSKITIMYGLASIILVITLVLYLKYSLSFEKIVLTVMLIETFLLLLMLLRKSGKKASILKQ